jgi:lipoprotein-anchoring transpeptidase ErfK/SrfK
MSRVAFRLALPALAASVAFGQANARPLSLQPTYPVDAIEAPPPGEAVPARGHMGGGFIEFLFGGGDGGARAYRPAAPAVLGDQGPRPPIDPRYLPQDVAYDGRERAGTIIIDTPGRFLYLVEAGGVARRYGIGVGRPGFTWAGVKEITAKREWPDWRPPSEMLARRPDLPTFMAGGPDNPLGARAMYLGSSLYRIHGSNEPETIGQAVSSGCFRMTNEDVVDLYGRVSIGAKVVVLR